MKKVLILCTGNSCRSQMGEAFARKYIGDRYEIFSAGTAKHGMNPRAVKVMEEIGFEMKDHYSKTYDEVLDTLGGDYIDVIVTVCSSAKEKCPYVPGKKTLHVGFEDPPALTRDLSDEQEILSVYRRVRDEISEQFKNLDKIIES